MSKNAKFAGMTLGKRIEKIRKERGLTMAELSELTGISRSQISYYESDEQKPSAHFLLSISEKLHTSMLYLLKGEEATSIEKMLPEINSLSEADHKKLTDYAGDLVNNMNLKLQLAKMLQDHS